MKEQAKQYRDYIILPALKLMDINSNKQVSGEVSTALMLGTIAQESQFIYIRQICFDLDNHKEGGFGNFQIELATHNDVVYRYMKQFNPQLFVLLDKIKIHCLSDAQNLMLNPIYSVIVARTKYLMVKEPLPTFTDDQYSNILKLANYWKTYYNTELGSGTVQQFVQNYKNFIV